MTAFPTGSGNHIPTDNLNQSTDKPKDARQDLYDMAFRINTIIDSFNANNGICGLTGSGKVDSAKLTGQIDTAQLATDAVNGDKIEDDAIDSEHITNGSVDYDHITFGATSTSLGTSNTLLPTQNAVKSYVDTQVGNVSLSVTTLERSSQYSVASETTTSNLPGVTITGSDVTVSNGVYTIQSGIYAVMLKADLAGYRVGGTHNFSNGVLRIDMHGGEPSPAFSLNETIIGTVHYGTGNFSQHGLSQILNCQGNKTFNIYFYDEANGATRTVYIKNFKLVFIKLT